ncbi:MULTISPECIES: Panacea domain-containing protein [Rhodomicrobium]|uniref:Panacea domain-containing protein n=1 Tax=Rhodomicrobium TaxID=1068 RepID=UPI000B4A7BA5|nr:MULTISPECIES: Panacea domain-containing protein [Rhodomicrobium]
MAPWFNIRKAAQVAAFFTLKERGEIYVLKLVKLMYLADRRFMELYDVPILNDQLVSMQHGPVNSISYDYLNGAMESEHWNEFLRDRESHRVSTSRDDLTEADLDELSKAELRVLQEVWDRFGHMGRFEIRDYTHDHCPEWEDPNGSSMPIPYSRVFNFLRKANSAELEDRILSERQVATSFDE